MYIPSPSKYDPDENGHFGIFGGRYVPETLMPALLELNEEYAKVRFNKEFWAEVVEREAMRDVVAARLVELYSYATIKRAFYIARRDTPEGQSDARYEAKEEYWNREEAKRG